jgi:hypothetical protein
MHQRLFPEARISLPNDPDVIINRQRQEIAVLRAALQPLADLTMAWMVECGDSLILYQTGDGDHMETITYGDIRRASAALRAE